jgi:hypothetical protein
LAADTSRSTSVSANLKTESGKSNKKKDKAGAGDTGCSTNSSAKLQAGRRN